MKVKCKVFTAPGDVHGTSINASEVCLMVQFR